MLVSFDTKQNLSRSITPSPNSNAKQIVARPQALAVQRTRGLSVPQPPAATTAATAASNQNPNVLHPLGVNYRGQLLPTSRQASSNTSEGGGNRESSLDDSGVVDDHDEQEIMNIELANLPTTDVSIYIHYPPSHPIIHTHTQNIQRYNKYQVNSCNTHSHRHTQSTNKMEIYILNMIYD